ncbi:MAG: hypothetical protein VX893_11445, partial [Candidatus Latescibacterota bacterium]|nr:hypothetical protein [Candidatus Latescibacterota bacterium]
MRLLVAPTMLIAAAALVYSNSLSNPFVFDDLSAIVGNHDIRQIWPPVWLDSSWHGSLFSRPFVMFSLALSYAAGGADSFSFRLANLILHIGSGLLVYAVVRQLLHSPILRARVGVDARPLALACALIWLLHPLQSQCINYVIQRSEILMAFCALTALYAAQRGLTGGPWWSVLAVFACLMGMASKESMVGVPLLIPLCDRAMSGNINIWRRRFAFYLGLAATWLLLIWLLSDKPHRTTIGFDQGISAWTYAVNQCQAIIGYLHLAYWPASLVFDYGYPDPELSLIEVWPQALLLLAMLSGSAWLLYRHPAAGLAAAGFFILIAPTSSLVPLVKQVAAQRRMYLPLAALIGLTLCPLYILCLRRKFYLQLATVLTLCASLALGFA